MTKGVYVMVGLSRLKCGRRDVRESQETRGIRNRQRQKDETDSRSR
jgi:hypothetical protein